MDRWMFALLACVALFAPLAHAQEVTPSQVDKVLAAWDKGDTPGLALAVMREGQLVYSHGYGMANLEHGVANTPSTVFHAASLSKQFTSGACQGSRWPHSRRSASSARCA